MDDICVWVFQRHGPWSSRIEGNWFEDVWYEYAEDHYPVSGVRFAL